MPHILATYNVQYYWDIPADVVLLPVNEVSMAKEKEGFWYIRHALLHYYWKEKWYTIEGTEDGFTSACPNDAEFHED